MNEPSSGSSPWIVDTTEETFEADVIERSNEVPVVVDFWATWCQPCQVLGPFLEKLAAEYAGQFILVKAETEKVPRAATEFGVRGIPAVFGLKGGRIVDFFEGVLPEDQLRDWLTRIIPSEAEAKAADAGKLEASDPEAAITAYQEAIQLDPQLDIPKIQLAKLLLDQGRADESQELIEQLAERGFLEPEAERVKAALELRRKGALSSSVEDCRTAVEQDPGNLSRKLTLAESLAAEQQYNEALEICLDLVQRDRGGVRESARLLMIDIFRLLPEDSELTQQFRRKLSMALY